MKKVLLAYMPVLHQGYIDFMKCHSDAELLLIFGEEVIGRFDWLKRKDIRAVSPHIMRDVAQALGIMREVNLFQGHGSDIQLFPEDTEFVFAGEEESRQVAETFFGGCKVRFDNVFLRWDKPRILDEKNAEGFPITTSELHRRFMRQALSVAEKSADWWLHVGAVLVAGDRIFVAYNKHLPSDLMPYVLGDPRSFFRKGIAVELTGVLHSEVAVIGAAAREGVSTEGARLYVTNFPCPFCANALSETGISEIYFLSGYSMLDGADRLKDKGIKLFRVIMDEGPDE